MTFGSGRSSAIEVVMPQLGESVEVGTITRWLKSPGEAIAAGEPLYEVSSDKATMEIPALAGGYVQELLAGEGSEVPVGSVVALIAAARERISPIAAGRERLSPIVRRLLREHGLQAAAITGSAENGRITKADVLAHVAARTASVPREARVQAAPPVANISSAGNSERVPLSPMRLRTGERLSAAQKAAVNVFSVIEIDLETVAAERARRKLTYLPFIARATIDALRAYKALNASLDETAATLVQHPDVHLGIAVDLDERGLVVPVVRHAERLTLDGLGAEIARLADGARASKLRPDDYAGSTFTISNNGAFGTLLTAPVINAPNVAIVSTDAVELRPVVIDRMIAIRHRMYFCMTWDHRAFDGSTAARFLARVKHNLETWDWTTQ
jgi:2-oxoglutarate dehydrogenase E2 component (dihydrolipoamide succinyltransferase)